MNTLTSLPEDATFLIMKHLDVTSGCNLGRTCSLFKNFVVEHWMFYLESLFSTEIIAELMKGFKLTEQFASDHEKYSDVKDVKYWRQYRILFPKLLTLDIETSFAQIPKENEGCHEIQLIFRYGEDDDDFVAFNYEPSERIYKRHWFIKGRRDTSDIYEATKIYLEMCNIFFGKNEVLGFLIMKDDETVSEVHPSDYRN